MTSPTLLTDLGIGDVLAVRTGGIGGAVIRLGARIHHLPSSINHIAVMTHWTDGVPWGIEGRPGGVGPVDLRPYIASPATISNRLQHRTPAERQAIADAMTALAGTSYDWPAIIADGCDDLGLPALWAENWHGRGSPAHVVCSSVAALVYARLGLPDPTGATIRRLQPGHWARFIQTEGWR